MAIEAYGIETCGVPSDMGWTALYAAKDVGPEPGLYSTDAAADAWRALRLARRARIPLYMGKSEFTTTKREPGQHFAFHPAAQACMGGSTERRYRYRPTDYPSESPMTDRNEPARLGPG